MELEKKGSSGMKNIKPSPSFLIGFCIASISILYGASLKGVHLDMLVAPTALLMVGSAVAITPFTKRPRYDKQSITSALRSQQMGKNFLIASILALVLGIMQVLLFLGQPEKIGQGVAVSFIAMIYGATFFALSHAMSERFARRGQRQGADISALPIANQIGSYGIFVMMALLFTIFVILYALKGS